MSNKKQTAVEWLAEQIDNKDMGEIPMWIYDFIEQAKEMEKQQIIDFANNYGFDVCGYDYERAEQYYKETYK
jgi:hypothetical protein